MRSLSCATFYPSARLAVYCVSILALATSSEALRAVPPEAKPTIRFVDANPPDKPADQGDHACGGTAELPANRAKILALLARKVTFEVEGMKLRDFANAITELGGVRVDIDRRALASIDVHEDRLVTIRVQNMTLGMALKHALRKIDPTLECIDNDGSLIITTKEAAQEHLACEVYDVRDLVAPLPGRRTVRNVWADTPSPEEEAATELAELIRMIVEPASWDVEGGPGTVQPLSPGLLTISQTPSVHAQISALLKAFCEVRGTPRAAAGVPLQLRAVAPRAEREFAEQASQAMAKKVTLDFAETRLEKVIDHLSQLTGLTCLLDEQSLENINITGKSTVTLHVKNASLLSALKLIQRQLDPTLTWSCRDEALLLTTKEMAATEDFSQVLYPVHDLTDPDSASGLPAIDLKALEVLITERVEPLGWEREGGYGTFGHFRFCDALVIRQSAEVQLQIAKLLEDVRKIRRRQGEAKPKTKPPARETAKDLGTEINMTIYHLGAIGPQPLIHWPLAAAPQNSPENVAELKKIVIDSIGVDKWPAATTGMHSVGSKLIIRQTPAVQEHIRKLLHELGVLAVKERS